MQDDIKSKIAKSTAALSLQAEVKYATTLANHKWDTIRSFYYTDPTTEKAREIDVIGNRVWKAKNRKFGVQASLTLLLEAKTLKDYHILFAPMNRVPLELKSLHSLWVGSEIDPVRKQLITGTKQAGLGDDDISNIIDELMEMAYPRDGFGVILPLHIGPLNAPNYATTFRETKINSEQKDIDTSVLWHAGQSLSTAMLSMMHSERSHFLDSITGMIEENIAANSSPTEFVSEILRENLYTIHLFHPIVVLDAKLWMLDGPNLNEIEWCRFEQETEPGSSRFITRDRWWFDIVQSSFFDTYAANISSYYEKQFATIRRRLARRRTDPDE